MTSLPLLFIFQKELKVLNVVTRHDLLVCAINFIYISFCKQSLESETTSLFTRVVPLTIYIRDTFKSGCEKPLSCFLDKQSFLEILIKNFPD